MEEFSTNVRDRCPYSIPMYHRPAVYFHSMEEGNYETLYATDAHVRF